MLPMDLAFSTKDFVFTAVMVSYLAPAGAALMVYAVIICSVRVAQDVFMALREIA